jgi:hypothetical protein
MELLGKPKEPEDEPLGKANPNYRISKRWRRVSKLSHPNNLKGTNETISIQYHNALKLIKREYLEPGTQYFERDYSDFNDDPFTVHSFICRQLSFVLTCDFHCHMQIEYDFVDFPHSEDILWRVAYVGEQKMLFHKPRQPSLAESFNGVLGFQDPQYLHFL